MSVAETRDRPVSEKMLARKDGRVGTMIFNNPERHNAVSLEMWDMVSRILDDFASDPDINVVVITGAGGKAFVSGADISKFGDERANKDAVAHYNDHGRARLYAAARIPEADHCDDPRLLHRRRPGACGVLRHAHLLGQFALRAAGRQAQPRLRLYRPQALHRSGRAGLHQGDLLHRAPVHAPRRRTRWGWSIASCRRRELESYVKNYADTIGANAPLTIKAVKVITTEILKEESKRDLARCQAVVQECFDSEDYIEGRNAFMQKRKPVFKGR